MPKVTLDEFLTGLQLPPTVPYVGRLKNNDYILAVGFDGEVDPMQYAICERGVEDYGHTIDAETEEFDFMNDGRGDATGHIEDVTSIHPVYAYAGRRYVGDYFQDQCFKIRYKRMVLPYARVNLRTGETETGMLTVAVTEPGGNGAAPEWANIAIDMTGTGIPVDGILPFPPVA